MIVAPNLIKDKLDVSKPLNWGFFVPADHQLLPLPSVILRVALDG